MHLRQQGFAGGDGPALGAGPGTDPAGAGAGAKVDIAVGGGRRLHQPLDAHLAVHVVPVHHGRSARIFTQFQAFAGLEVGVEDDITGTPTTSLHSTMRAAGQPSSVAVARVMALGLGLQTAAPGLCQPLTGQQQRLRGQRVPQNFRSRFAHQPMVSRPQGACSARAAPVKEGSVHDKPDHDPN